MKNSLVLVLAMVSLLVGTATGGTYSGGTGEPNDPYRIATAQDLNDIGNHQEDWDKNFILVNDVNLAQYTGIQIGLCSGNYFTGVFDGNNHKIWNFTSDSPSLFGCVGPGGQIKNLGVENVDVSGGNVGGLVGENLGTITNCHSTGIVSGMPNVGGLVGFNDGMMTNCYSAVVALSCGSYTGGLVGQNGVFATITDCYSTSYVFPNGMCKSNAVGGLVAINYGGTITRCYSSSYLAPFADSAGGLVGENWGGTISYCYSASNNIQGWGGLVGYTEKGVVIASFWDVDSSNCPWSAGGTPKTTAEMKTKSTFTDAGWDFVDEIVNGPNDVWRMCVDGVEYPLLSWQFIPDFICPDGVDILDLAFLVDRWLAECDETNNFCNCTDTDYDGQVNLPDFAILASHWLEGQ
jgi:hypothetical protein